MGGLGSITLRLLNSRGGVEGDTLSHHEPSTPINGTSGYSDKWMIDRRFVDDT